MELGKTLESPLDSSEIKPVHPKGNQPWIIPWKDWCWSWSSGHLMWRVHSLNKTLVLGRIEGRRRKGQQRTRWLDSVDMSLSTLWETVKDSGAWGAAVHGVTKRWARLSDWQRQQQCERSRGSSCTQSQGDRWRSSLHKYIFYMSLCNLYFE